MNPKSIFLLNSLSNGELFSGTTQLFSYAPTFSTASLLVCDGQLRLEEQTDGLEKVYI